MFIGAFLGWMGAFFGRIAYQEHERTLQNHILYQAIQQEEPTSQTHATPLTANDSRGQAPAAEVDAEAARRAAIAADMAQAYREARLRRSQQTRAAVGAALILVVTLVVVGSQVYQGGAINYHLLDLNVRAEQTSTARVAATRAVAQETSTAITAANQLAAEQTATAILAATQTAQALIPYTAQLPGLNCDKGVADWTFYGSGTVTCEKSVVDITRPGQQWNISEELFDRPAYSFSSHYLVAITVASMRNQTCAGLLTNVQSDGPGAFGYEICTNGTWTIYRFDDKTGQSKYVIGGSTWVTSANRIQVTVNGTHFQFMVNGVTVWTMTTSVYPTTSNVGFYVSSINQVAGDATFRDFRFAELH